MKNMETTGVVETMSRNMSFREIINRLTVNFFGIHRQRLLVYYASALSSGLEESFHSDD